MVSHKLSVTEAMHYLKSGERITLYDTRNVYQRAHYLLDNGQEVSYRTMDALLRHKVLTSEPLGDLTFVYRLRGG